MNNREQVSPEDLSSENALICEKLLGWKRLGEAQGRAIWDCQNERGDGHAGTPSFTTWAEAGLILEALGSRSIRWHLTRSIQFGVFIFSLDPIGSPGGEWQEKRDRSGPLAIRAAALEYIRSLP